MLAIRPLGGSALLSPSLPPAIPDPFSAISRGRGTEFAVILEISGFPKFAPLDSGGAHPLLGASLLNGPGMPGEVPGDSITPVILMLSDYAYRTKPSDPIRPNLYTEARMTRRADIEQSAPISQGASRRSQDTTGDLEFADNDGFLQSKGDDFSFDGRPASIHIVEIGQPWGAVTTISQAVVRSLTRSKGSVRVNLEDAANILDTPLITRVYGGTGLRDGSPDLKDTSPPGGWGECKFAKPLLEDPGIYLYRLSDAAIQSVSLVEERGIPFIFAGDVASYELLRIAASTIAEGEYATCLADGSIVIKFAGGSPLDPDAIRVTFEGQKPAGTYVSFIGDVMVSMMRDSMGVSGSQIDFTSFDGLPQEKISYYFAGGEPSPTGAQAFNEIMDSAFGIFGSVNSDKIGAKLWFPPNNQAAAHTFAANDINSVDEVEPPQKPVWSQTIGYGPNQNPYAREQLAIGSLTEVEIEERTREFEATYVKESAPVKASNLRAVQGSFIRSVFDELAPAQDAVDRLMGVWGVDAKAFEVDLMFVASNVRRGDVISMTHHDFGEKSGGKFLVYSKRLQLSKRRVILTVIG